MKPGLFAAVVVAVFLLGFAVGRTSVQPASAPMPSAAFSPPSMGSANPAPSGPGMGMGMGMGEMGQAPATGVVTGVISEVIQVPNYTYLNLTTSKGEEWAAVNTTPSAEKGQTVIITNASMMANFTSSTLKRTFPSIWFGQLQPGAGAEKAAAPSSPPMGGGVKPASSSATAGALAAIQKADGPLGLRVSDVFAERKALSGQSVRVRGMVTKVSAVQGLNYVHVKDGSGASGSGNDDLTVVTKATVKVDDVVTVEGRVAVDKDLGMGPRPVVVEEANIVAN